MWLFSRSLMLLLISWILHVLLVLLSVAFFTLFERKVIGLFHIRIGPNKVSFIGVLQPLLDAFKLLTKQSLTPLHSNKFIYNLSPMLALLLSLFLWSFISLGFSFSSGSFSFIMFFCVGSFIVFSVLLSGWSSNSKYRLVGCLRSVAQSISYESVFSTVLVLFVFLISSFSLKSFFLFSSPLFFFLAPIWFICTLAETHRAPFDFSEAESELVSGFNTEYSGAYFAFIFLSEYSVLLFSSILFVWIFLSFFIPYSYFIVILLSLFVSFIFIWVRITFCRFRYDKLMIISWKVLLPFSISIFLVYSFVVVIFVLYSSISLHLILDQKI